LLSFGDKIKLLKVRGASRLLARYSTMYVSKAVSVEMLLADLREVETLRDDVAHDKETLVDHSCMFRRLAIAHSLAHAFTLEAE